MPGQASAQAVNGLALLSAYGSQGPDTPRSSASQREQSGDLAELQQAQGERIAPDEEGAELGTHVPPAEAAPDAEPAAADAFAARIAVGKDSGGAERPPQPQLLQDIDLRGGYATHEKEQHRHDAHAASSVQEDLFGSKDIQQEGIILPDLAARPVQSASLQSAQQQSETRVEPPAHVQAIVSKLVAFVKVSSAPMPSAAKTLRAKHFEDWWRGRPSLELCYG